MKNLFRNFFIIFNIVFLTSCGTNKSENLGDDSDLNPDLVIDEEDDNENDEEEVVESFLENEMIISNGEKHIFTLTLFKNESVDDLISLIYENENKLELNISSYGNFEYIASLPRSIKRNDERIEAKSGDVVLYNGNTISIMYGENSWSYTLLGRIKETNEGEIIKNSLESYETIELALN